MNVAAAQVPCLWRTFAAEGYPHFFVGAALHLSPGALQPDSLSHMRLVVDAIAVRPGSAAIVISNLLTGWSATAPEDEITVLTDGRPQFSLPDTIAVKCIATRSSAASRAWAQSVGLRRTCRTLQADALLSAVTASAFLGAPCRHGVIVYDLRHELRPEQFSTRRRLGRRLLYGWSFRTADALFCISERTRNDLLAARPELSDKAHVGLLGADHATAWHGSMSDNPGYVLAFGHFANKNVAQVLRAWQVYVQQHGDGRLRVCGLGADARRRADELVGTLRITEHVELLPWLDDNQFESVFAGASAVMFPSDFEGFGLPAVEALLLGVPVVVSPDPALLEVTGGHAVVAADDRPETLAVAIEKALALSPEQIRAGADHARSFTWERTARTVRDVLTG